jgi:hypothetical protein
MSTEFDANASLQICDIYRAATNAATSGYVHSPVVEAFRGLMNYASMNDVTMGSVFGRKLEDFRKNPNRLRISSFFKHFPIFTDSIVRLLTMPTQMPTAKVATNPASESCIPPAFASDGDRESDGNVSENEDSESESDSEHGMQNLSLSQSVQLKGLDVNSKPQSLYIMQNLQIANFFKVGISSNPSSRLKKAKTFSPFMILILESKPYEANQAKRLEQKILRDAQLSQFRIGTSFTTSICKVRVEF